MEKKPLSWPIVADSGGDGGGQQRERSEKRREEGFGFGFGFGFGKVFNVLNEKLIAKFALASVCLDFWGLAYIRDSLSKLSSTTLLERPICKRPNNKNVD